MIEIVNVGRGGVGDVNLLEQLFKGAVLADRERDVAEVVDGTLFIAVKELELLGRVGGVVDDNAEGGDVLVDVVLGAVAVVISITLKDKAVSLGPVHRTHLEGAAADQRRAALCPVGVRFDDVVTKGDESRAAKGDEEVVNVDILLKFDLNRGVIDDRNGEVVNRLLAFGDVACILDVVEQCGCGVRNIGVEEAAEGELNVVCRHRGAVRPAGRSQVELEGVLARLLILDVFIALNQCRLGLAVFVGVKERLKQEANDLKSSLIVKGSQGVKVVNRLGEIHTDVSTLIQLAVRAGGQTKRDRDTGENQSPKSFHHFGLPP